MNIELTDLDMILNYLETTSLEPHDDYTSEITYKDQKILYKYIKNLQQENQQLKEIIDKAVLELVNIDGNLSNSQLSDRLCNLIDILQTLEDKEV